MQLPGKVGKNMHRCATSISLNLTRCLKKLQPHIANVWPNGETKQTSPEPSVATFRPLSCLSHRARFLPPLSPGEYRSLQATANFARKSETLASAILTNAVALGTAAGMRYVRFVTGSVNTSAGSLHRNSRRQKFCAFSTIELRSLF